MQSGASEPPQGDLARVLESDRFGIIKQRKTDAYRAKKARAATTARERLTWIILFDVVITIIEVAGAILSGGSLALWANALTGFYDAVLLSLNWWGLGHEANGRPKRAKKFARWSDVGLIAGYLGIVVWAGSKLLGDEPHHVEGTIVFVVASIAAAVNYLSARRLPRKSGNGKSAAVKLYAGAAIALATIASGLVLIQTGFWRIDPLITMAIGVTAITIASIRLAKPKRNEPK